MPLLMKTIMRKGNTKTASYWNAFEILNKGWRATVYPILSSRASPNGKSSCRFMGLVRQSKHKMKALGYSTRIKTRRNEVMCASRMSLKGQDIAQYMSHVNKQL